MPHDTHDFEVALSRLRGHEVTLQCEDPDRPGMALGRRGVVETVGVGLVQLADQEGVTPLEMIEKVEVRNPGFQLKPQREASSNVG